MRVVHIAWLDRSVVSERLFSVKEPKKSKINESDAVLHPQLNI